MRETYLGSAAVLLFALFPFQVNDDALVVAPEAYKITLENEYVRVVQLSLAPGQKTAMHTHGGSPVVLVGFSEGRFKLTDATGKVREGQGKFGSVTYSPGHPMKHQSENVGTVPLRDFRVELKADPPRVNLQQDAVQLDPAHNKLETENDRVRVVRIKFGPGEKGPVVDKRPRVIVFLTDMDAQVISPEGRKETRKSKAGQVMWGAAGKQATENASDKAFEALVIELKGKE